MSTRKVFGWTHHRGSTQTREIVMTTSWQRAAEIAGDNITVGFLRKYGSTTQNSEEWEVARLNPGVVLWRPLDGSRRLGAGWQRADGQPLIGNQFDEQKRNLLRRAMSSVKELQDLNGQEPGWAELYSVELNLLSTANAMGIPQSQITESVNA